MAGLEDADEAKDESYGEGADDDDGDDGEAAGLEGVAG